MCKFIVVISGKTCSGKTYLLEKLLEKTLFFSKLVTSTTRPKRTGEVNGLDYHFISSAQAEENLQGGEFVESNVHGKYLYGLTKEELNEKLNLDKIPCIILTPNGLQPYKELLAPYGVKVLSIYINCSEDLQFDRLANRVKDELAWRKNDEVDVIKESLLRVQSMVLKEIGWDDYISQYDCVIDAGIDDIVTAVCEEIMVYSRKNP